VAQGLAVVAEHIHAQALLIQLQEQHTQFVLATAAQVAAKVPQTGLTVTYVAVVAEAAVHL
jgi:hypothetical protein